MHVLRSPNPLTFTEDDTISVDRVRAEVRLGRIPIPFDGLVQRKPVVPVSRQLDTCREFPRLFERRAFGGVDVGAGKTRWNWIGTAAVATCRYKRCHGENENGALVRHVNSYEMSRPGFHA